MQQHANPYIPPPQECTLPSVCCLISLNETPRGRLGERRLEVARGLPGVIIRGVTRPANQTLSDVAAIAHTSGPLGNHSFGHKGLLIAASQVGRRAGDRGAAGEQGRIARHMRP